MTKVIGVRFRTAGKIYFFSPGEFEIKQGDHVIVETARGIEYGRVVSAPKEVDDDSVVQPLKSVIRIATEQDEKTVEKNRIRTRNRTEENTVTKIPGTAGSISGETKGIYKKTVYAWEQKQLFQNRS